MAGGVLPWLATHRRLLGAQMMFLGERSDRLTVARDVDEEVMSTCGGIDGDQW